MNRGFNGIKANMLSRIIESRELNIGPLYLACERYDLEAVGREIEAVTGQRLPPEEVERWVDSVIEWHYGAEQQGTDWYVRTFLKCLAIEAGMFPPGCCSPAPAGRYAGLRRPSIEETQVLLTPVDRTAGSVVNWWRRGG